MAPTQQKRRKSLAAADAEAHELLTGARVGEAEAFSALHDRHAAGLLSYLRGMLGDAADAEDAAQEVWASVLRSLPDFEHRDVPVRVWLYRVARNQALNQLARRAHSFPEEPQALARRQEASPPPASAEPLPDPELVRVLHLLPLAQRQVVVLRFVADLSVAEVGEVIGRSQGAVEQLQRRGLAFLRARLAPVHERRRPPLAFGRRPAPHPVLAARRLALSWTL